MQLRALLASDVNDQFTFDQYLTFRLASLGGALVSVAGVAAFTQSNWRLAGVVILIGLAQAMECVGDTYYGFMQKHDCMDRISASLMLKGPLSLGALYLAMKVSGSVVWAVVGLILGRLFILWIWDSHYGLRPPRVPFTWNSRGSLALLRTALPLG